MPTMKLESTAEIKPQRREERRDEEWVRSSALFASPRFLRTRSGLRCSPAQHDPTETLSEGSRVEVNDQTQLPSSQPELAQQLGFMYWLNFRQGIMIHHNASAVQQFDFIQVGQRRAFVAKCQGAVALEGYAPQVQFMTQARLVCRGQQARPQLAVDLDCTGDYLAGQCFSFSISTVRCGIEGRRRVRIPRSSSGGFIRPCVALPLFFQTEHQSLYAFLQDGHVEVEQQCQLPSSQLEIGQRLRSMHWKDSFHRFHLDHHNVADKHIETKAALKLHALVNHRHRLLHTGCKASQSEFACERPFVSRFGFPGSKFTMHLDSRADDCMGKLVRSHRRRIIVVKRRVNNAKVGANGMAL